jgi:hypothetical protein
MGYTVYMIDLPPVGRSNRLEVQPMKMKVDRLPVCLAEREITAPGRRPESQFAYPEAKLHTQWPGVSAAFSSLSCFTFCSEFSLFTSWLFPFWVAPFFPYTFDKLLCVP